MLTLLKGGNAQQPPGLVPLPPPEGSWEESPPLRALAHRPGDHLELWKFESIGTLRSLRREARERGLNADTAIAIVCERRIANSELEDLGLNATVAAIERAAAAAEAPISMWAANRAYLRHLRYGDPLERNSRTPLATPQAAVPIRLLEHLGERDVLAAPLARDELPDALRWEIAALCAAKSIGEWAYATALAALANPGTLAAVGAR